jgi:segregation and condensation protein B
VIPPDPDRALAATDAIGGPGGPVPPDEAVLRLAEAMVFAAAGPVLARALARVLPDGCDAEAVIEALRARYAGRGVELADVAGGVQFRTALDLAPALRKVIEVPRRLTRVAMETLAIVAYHQPITRAEIEQMRGASLSQQTLDALLEAKLVAPSGRKDAPGRPTLWATTPEFLTAFGLTDLRALPRREDLFVEPPRPAAERPANDLCDPSPDTAARAASGVAPAPGEPTGEPTVSPGPASC